MDVRTIGDEVGQFTQTKQRGFRSAAKRSCAATHWVIAAVSLVVLASFSGDLSADSHKLRAKASYLHSLAHFVTGLDDPHAANDGELIIGVLGEGELRQALAHLPADLSAAGKHIRVEEFVSFADYTACDILFIAGNVSADLQNAIIRQTDQQPVLVVAETPGFCQRGGTVNLRHRQNGSMEIEMNIDAVSRHRLVVDARLMRLAKIVRDPERNGLP